MEALRERFADDAHLARMPGLIAKPEMPNISLMEAYSAYIAASSLPATAEVVDGPTVHRDVVFPTSILEPRAE